MNDSGKLGDQFQVCYHQWSLVFSALPSFDSLQCTRLDGALGSMIGITSEAWGNAMKCHEMPWNVPIPRNSKLLNHEKTWKNDDLQSALHADRCPWRHPALIDPDLFARHPLELPRFMHQFGVNVSLQLVQPGRSCYILFFWIDKSSILNYIKLNYIILYYIILNYIILHLLHYIYYIILNYIILY